MEILFVIVPLLLLVWALFTREAESPSEKKA